MKQWQEIIDKHNVLVQKHVEFLESIRSNNGQDTSHTEDDDITELVQLCFKQTAIMTQNIQMLQTRLRLDDKSNDRESVKFQGAQDQAPINVSTKPNQQAAEVKVDETGLFMTDTNPTPIDQLLQQKPTTTTIRTKEQGQVSDKPKRKISDQEMSQEIGANGKAAEEPRRKRKRLEADTVIEGPATDFKAQSSAQQSNDDDSFVKEVAARVQDKEKSRWKKNNKKRKRGSGDSINEKSTEVNIPVKQLPPVKDMDKPRKKRHKRNKSANGTETKETKP